VTKDALYFNEKFVAPLANGSVAREAKEQEKESSYLIKALLDELPRTPSCIRRDEKLEKRIDDPMPWLFIAAQPETRYRVLTEVLYTVGQARYREFALIARDGHRKPVAMVLHTPTIY
jgi:hypothetical protein